MAQARTATAVTSAVNPGEKAMSLRSITTPIEVSPIVVSPTSMNRLAIRTRCSLSPWRNRIRCQAIGAVSMIRVAAADTSVPK